MGKANRTKYPLRKVMFRVPGKPYLVELECGHQMCASSDIYGDTNPNRQRCVYCEPKTKLLKE